MKHITWNIQTRIVSLILGVVFILTISFSGLLLYQYTLINRYNSIVNTMVQEHHIIANVDELINSYYNQAKIATTSISFDSFYAQKDTISKSITYLDSRITYKQSLVKYRGLKNILQNIQNDLEIGINEVSSGDISRISEHYQSSRDKQEYLNDSVTELILNELEYLSQTQAEHQSTQKRTALIAIGALVIITMLCLYIAIYFSKSIISPIHELSKTANMFTFENPNLHINPKYFKRKDEIGVLSQSLQTMLTNLTATISKLNTSQKNMQIKNEELEKFNKLVINRELKMVELKKEIVDLRNQINKV